MRVSDLMSSHTPGNKGAEGASAWSDCSGVIGLANLGYGYSYRTVDLGLSNQHDMLEASKARNILVRRSSECIRVQRPK